MKIHLYTLCWNEADILGFFFRHYDPFVDRYVIYDDGSTDGSIEILRAHSRVELRRFEREIPDSFVLSHQRLQNEMWKESRGRADWVIVTALDEHLTVPDKQMANYLAQCQTEGVTLVPGIGYQMLSEDFPGKEEHLATTRRVGAPYMEMNKLAIFDPDALTDTSFTVGRHSAEPRGRLQYPRRDALMVLHYKLMGFERSLQRSHQLCKGLGPTDVKNRWGYQYHRSEQQFRIAWDRFAANAIDLDQPDFDPAQPGQFQAPLWWRQLG